MMKILIFLLFSLISINANVIKTIPDDVDLLSDQMIEHINNLNTTWKAGKNFDGIPVKHLIGLLGVKEGPENDHLEKIYHLEIDEIPTNFDAREKWPNCKSISKVFDQGSCGSCWAFGAVSCMSDRYCIHSNGAKHVELSAENLVTCCSSCGFGCKGGFPISAWRYWVDKGIVSGGQYQSHSGCQPYKVEPCQHHTKGPRKPCGDLVATPQCLNTCEKGSNITYSNDKHFGEKAYSIHSNVKQIQLEIMKNGPVEASYDVYADFYNYKSGVYQHHTNQMVGRHAVRILGWGVEKNVPYWLVANSWNSDWGDNGFFKILRGSNECKFESDITAGMPKI